MVLDGNVEDVDDDSEDETVGAVEENERSEKNVVSDSKFSSSSL